MSHLLCYFVHYHLLQNINHFNFDIKLVTNKDLPFHY